MITKDFLQVFTLKMLFMREWKWLLTIFVVSISWMVGTFFYARATMSQVWINTPHIAKNTEDIETLKTGMIIFKESIGDIKTDVREIRNILLEGKR